MRVLQVLEATLGGTRRYLNDIADANIDVHMGFAYARARSDVQFSAFLERVEAAGWDTYQVPMIRSVRPREDLRAAIALRTAIHRFRPDIIHAHSSKAGALARIVARTFARRIGVIYSPHAISTDLNVAFKAVEGLLARVTARFVAVSDSERDQLVSLRLAPVSRIDVVYPVIDGSRFARRSTALDESRLASSAPLILGVGRLCEQKDPLAFYDIVSSLKRRLPDLQARWVGDGELRQRLEHRIASDEAGHWFSIAGWIADVRPEISSASLMLSTARYESFGYATAEALAMECPVVASRVTGTRDVMTGGLTGWMFTSGNTAEAADVCFSTLTDRSGSTKLARAARDYIVRRFSSPAMGSALLESYARAR